MYNINIFDEDKKQFTLYLLAEKRVCVNTQQAYMRDVEQFFAYATVQTIDPIAFSTDLVKKFLGHLQARNLSARSMARKIASLKSFFFYRHLKGLGPNCAGTLITPKIEKKLPRPLSEEEVECLFKIACSDTKATFSSIRNKLLVILLYVSGMRISELVNLKITDVHFETALLLIHGKGGRQRLIPLPFTILTLVRDYIQDNLRAVSNANKKFIKSEYLFPTFYKNEIRAMSRQAAWTIIKKIWRKTGLERAISPHTLRHSLATHLLKNGADLRSLQLLLGHAHIGTTQIYTHLDTRYLRTIYDKKHPRA